MALSLLGWAPLGAVAAAGAEGDVQTLPLQRARIFAVPSDRATVEMAAVLEEFGFRLRVDEPRDGLFVTRITPIARLRKHGLQVPAIEGAQPREVEVHAFVSGALEPAHVHVDAIVTTVERHDGTSAHAYSEGDVERQVLDTLEKRLGVPGEAIPLDLEARRQVASRLRGRPTPCCFDGSARVPEVLRQSKSRVLYPASPLRRGESGKVVLLTRILSDGSTLPLRILHGAPVLHSKDLEAAAMAAVGLWRFRPAQTGGCPIDMPMTVAVDFSSGP
jgi:TonB family protein